MENKQHIRFHLTKEQRLPRCFKEVEKVLRSVKSCQQNYKTILANSRLRGHIHKKVYSLTVNVLKYYSYIQKIIDQIQLLEKEKYLRREIASILIYELIFGSGFLPGESKVVKTVQQYEKDIFHAHEILQNRTESRLIIEINIPRYVRVHTLVTTVPYVIKDLTSCGYNQINYDDNLSEERYLELVKNLNKGSFLIDFHFKDMLVFEHHENLTSLDLYKNGHIFLQDKSSYIPVHVLNPQPGCAVLDACAAPGMKTIHIAAKMKNKGILIACERDKSRFENLKEMLDCGSVKICKTLCKDFKLIDPSDQAYSIIEYILLDPSCSGSGMVNRLDEVTDTENSKNTERLMKLAGFQIILLKHSLKFPAVKKVVYSTCSVHEEENEYVVHEALNAFNGTFKLTTAMPEWSHRGSEKFEFGNLCLRTDPKMHLTNGFFVAVFERINYENADEYNQYQVHEGYGERKQKRKSSKLEESYEQRTENYPDSEYTMLLNKPDIKSENSVQGVNYETEQNSECAEQLKKIHKKKKKVKNERFYEANQSNLKTSNEPALKYPKSKKHPNVSLSENDNSASIHTKKDLTKYDECSDEKNLHENIEDMGECSGVIKLHKKKKKKKEKEHFETEVLQTEQLSKELEDNSSSNFTSKDVSAQNKHVMSISCGNSEELINVTSSHKKKKKKKKKEHSNIDSTQTSEKLEESITSLSCMNDANRNHSVSNVSEVIETVEGLEDLILAHKKKKKKKKHKSSVEKMI